MRITNKIMHNNSLYNINQNKVAEDKLNTMTATNKKITRPSDDPIIAIRALSLRSNVSELTQYYDKNASDAESWLTVTEDALSTVNDVLTDMRKLAVKGSNQYLSISDADTIITQMEKLADEYYSTGNEDYAGRYIFTGYRTDTSLTYDSTYTENYTGINDEFNASDVGSSSRITGLGKLSEGGTGAVLESDIVQYDTGRIRLSYSNLKGTETDPISLKYRTSMDVNASTAVNVSETNKTISLSYEDTAGKSYKVNIPTDGHTVTSGGTDYSASVNTDGSYSVVIGADTVQVSASGVVSGLPASITKASSVMAKEKTSSISFTDNGSTVKMDVPVTGGTDKPYTIAVTSTKDGAEGDKYTVTVNTDGTYSVRQDTAAETDDAQVINLNANGSSFSSYTEHTIKPSKVIDESASDTEMDTIYKTLSENTTTDDCVLNADTGELLLSSALKDKLTALSKINNANSIDVVYDKNEWEKGDLRPENLFKCTKDNIIYNGGNSSHIMNYDVGYNQTIEVNTTADQVFTTDVSRNVEDLRKIYDQMSSLNDRITSINSKIDAATDDTTKQKLQSDLAAAKKAYSCMQENMQDQFGSKITNIQKSLDKTNIAVTENGTRSKRLSLVQTRLKSQLTTFKTLQSENEDADLAETATNLSSAELTYQASLMATGKIMQTSLINYL